MTYNLKFKLLSISEHLYLRFTLKYWTSVLARRAGQRFRLLMTPLHIPRYTKHHCIPRKGVLNRHQKRRQPAPDEERWLFVGKDPCCPPSPKRRDHPSALFDEVEKVIRRSYDLWIGRSEEAAIASLVLRSCIGEGRAVKQR